MPQDIQAVARWALNCIQWDLYTILPTRLGGKPSIDLTARRGGQHQRPSPSRRPNPGGHDVQRRVHVRVGFVSATDTRVFRLADPRRRVHRAIGVARLRRVSGVDPHHAGGLVFEHRRELSPRAREYPPVQAGLRLDMAPRTVRVAPGRFGHAFHLQILDADQSGRVGDCPAHMVAPVFAAVRTSARCPGEQVGGLSPAIAPLPPPRHHPLAASAPRLQAPVPLVHEVNDLPRRAGHLSDVHVHAYR